MWRYLFGLIVLLLVFSASATEDVSLVTSAPCGTMIVRMTTQDGTVPLRSVSLTHRPRSVSLGFDAWYNQIAARHPLDFVGCSGIDWGAVAAQKAWIQKRVATEAISPKDALSFPLLGTGSPLKEHHVRILEKRAPGVSISPDASSDEVLFAILVHGVQSDPTVRTPEDQEAERLFCLDLLGPGPAKVYSVAEASSKSGNLFPFQNAGTLPLMILDEGDPDEEDFGDEHAKTTAQMMMMERCPIFYGVEGPLGLNVLIYAAIQGVTLVGLDPCQAHGINFSRLGFSTHDMFHGLYFNEAVFFGFYNFVKKMSALATHYRVDRQEFISCSEPHFLSHTTQVVSIYDFLYQQMTFLLIKGDTRTYSSVQLALFLLLHEWPFFLAQTDDNETDPTAIVGHHVEVVERFFYNKELIPESYMGTSFTSGPFVMDDGSSTNRFNVMINSDYLKLLRGAGYSVEDPLLTGEWAHDVEPVTTCYDNVKNALRNVFGTFSKWAQGVMDPGILAPQPTFAAKFRRQARETQAAIRRIASGHSAEIF